MPLRRLAGLERKKILDELAELLKTISYLEDLLGNNSRVLALIKQETNELKDKFGDERRTEINQEGIKEFREEDLIPMREMAVILSNAGLLSGCRRIFIKRSTAAVKKYRYGYQRRNAS